MGTIQGSRKYHFGMFAAELINAMRKSGVERKRAISVLKLTTQYCGYSKWLTEKQRTILNKSFQLNYPV